MDDLESLLEEMAGGAPPTPAVPEITGGGGSGTASQPKARAPNAAFNVNKAAATVLSWAGDPDTVRAWVGLFD